MQHSLLKNALLAVILASALPLAACGDDATPTSPTQGGPPIARTGPIVTITGRVANLDRSGAGDMDISFRIDDFTIVRAMSTTPVESGSLTFRTDAVRNGQTVTVDGRRTGGFLDAVRIAIVAQAP